MPNTVHLAYTAFAKSHKQVKLWSMKNGLQRGDSDAVSHVQVAVHMQEGQADYNDRSGHADFRLLQI